LTRDRETDSGGPDHSPALRAASQVGLVGVAHLVAGETHVAPGRRLHAFAGCDELRVALERELEDLVIGVARRGRSPDDAAAPERRVGRAVGVETSEDEVAVLADRGRGDAAADQDLSAPAEDEILQAVIGVP
jgi:hypothetical protein